MSRTPPARSAADSVSFIRLLLGAVQVFDQISLPQA